MMFFVSEVHPFTDGNGRLARIMMNSELSRAGQTRVIIPTVLHLEYLSTLTSLTHNGRADGLITVLDFAQRYTAQTDFSTLESATQMLTTTNAFEESATAAERGKRIILPSQLPLGWEFAEPDQNRGVADPSLSD
jgi:Fic family protein